MVAIGQLLEAARAKGLPVVYTTVSYGEGDFAQVSTEAFFNRLPNPNKHLVVYRDAQGSGGHCEGLGPTRYFSDLYGWLRDLWP